MRTEFREYREVPIDTIDADDHSFLISYPLSDDEVRRSVERVGVLNPLLLRQRGGRLQIISGFRRLSACTESGVKKVPALLYPESTEPLSAFTIAVHENLSRGYNLIEEGNILHKLVNLLQVPAEEVVENYMPLLGLNPSCSLLKAHLSLQNLTEGMKSYVYGTDMPISCAARMASYGPLDQEALLTFLHPLKPGVNKLREILVHAEETAARLSVDIADVLSREELIAVRESDASRPLKIDMARKALRKMRFPAVSATEAQIERWVKSLRLPHEIALHLPPSLEGDTIRAELKFRSAEDLRRLAEKLIEASAGEEIKKILELL